MPELSDQAVSRTISKQERRDADQCPLSLVEDQISRRASVFESTLLSFGRALGGEPADIADLPFTEQADECTGRPQRYVEHDEQLLGSIASALESGEHVGVCSEPGTGKTMLKRRLVSSMHSHREFVATAVDRPADATPRQPCERVLRAAEAAGYGIDPDDYWQVDSGVPWRTAEMERAFMDVTFRAHADGARILLAVDECESLSPKLRTQLQTLADSGVTLLLFGRPGGEPVMETLANSVSDPLSRYDGIDPFDVGDVAAYVTRSLAVFRGESPGDLDQDLFSSDILHTIYHETRGNPRAVRETCFELFVRGALAWEKLDVPVERVTITPKLVECDIDSLAGLSR